MDWSWIDCPSEHAYIRHYMLPFVECKLLKRFKQDNAVHPCIHHSVFTIILQVSSVMPVVEYRLLRGSSGQAHPDPVCILTASLLFLIQVLKSDSVAQLCRTLYLQGEPMQGHLCQETGLIVWFCYTVSVKWSSVSSAYKMRFWVWTLSG